MPPVIERMNRHAPYHHYDNPLKALDEYLEEFKSDSDVGFSITYRNRVYTDTANSEPEFLQCLPAVHGINYMTTIFELVQDGFSRLKFGIPYETLEKVNNLLNDKKKKKIT